MEISPSLQRHPGQIKEYWVAYITGINHKLVQGKLESTTNDNLIPYLKRKQLLACIRRGWLVPDDSWLHDSDQWCGMSLFTLDLSNCLTHKWNKSGGTKRLCKFAGLTVKLKRQTLKMKINSEKKEWWQKKTQRRDEKKIYRDILLLSFGFSGINILSNPPWLRECCAQCKHPAKEEKEGMEKR